MLRFWAVIGSLFLLTFSVAAQDIYFEDDFENGDTGWGISLGSYAIEGGRLSWEYEGDNFIYLNHDAFTPLREAYEISFDLKLSSANNAWVLGLTYNYTDDPATSTAIVIYDTGDFYHYNRAGVITERERDPYPLADGAFHHIRVVHTASGVQLLIDGTLLHEVVHDSPVDGEAAIMLGARTQRGATTIRAEIDNYVLKPYAPSAPVLPEGGVAYNQQFSVSIDDRRTLTFPFLVRANDVVDFAYAGGSLDSPIYSVFMPDGSLWIRESDDFRNTMLPVGGIWHIEFSNRSGRTLRSDFVIRLISTEAETITSLDSFTPADISGRFLSPIFRRIYVSPTTGLALLHGTEFLVGERADGVIVVSEDQGALDAALADPGFITAPEHALRYIWLREDSTTDVGVAPQAVYEEHFSQFAARQENLQTAFSWRDWYFWRFIPAGNDNYNARTFAIRLDRNTLAVGYEVHGSRSRFDEFDSVDIIESLGMSFPYLDDEDRAALGLPLTPVDAPTIEIDVDLPHTHTTSGFSFSYPDGAWRVSESTDANMFSGMLGLPAILVHEAASGETAQVAFFVAAPAAIFSASTWMDILNLSGAQMLGVEVDYQVEQAYVGDNLLTIIETDAAASGTMLRLEVRMRNARTVTMMVDGDAVGLIDRDTLLAIAGSLTP